MTHTYAAYKTPTSEQKPYTDWKRRVGKKYSKQIDREKKAGVVVLISEKTNFKTRAIIRDAEGHFTTDSREESIKKT